MKFIKEFRPGDRVTGVYLCKSRQELTSRNGKPYLSMILADKTGTVDTKVWNLTGGIDDFDPPAFIWIDGDVKLFNNDNQLSLRRLRKADEEEYRPEDYVPASKYNIQQMYAALMTYVDSVKEEHLNRLLNMFFREDEEFIDKFKKHSAAKSVHHGFVGGLLEHTLSVTSTCAFFAKHYPMINYDLLITAAMCHDIGKLEELNEFPMNDYTDEGQLIGHVVMSTIMVHDKIREIDGFPPKLAHELEHCILAHHGQLEYGSPKKPALLEALALHLADFTDARMETFMETLDAHESTDWLGYNRFLESNIRKTSHKD